MATRAQRTRRPSREPLMRTTDVAHLFDVSPETVITWAKDGRLSSIRTPGGQFRFRQTDVDALLATPTRPVNEKSPSGAPTPDGP